MNLLLLLLVATATTTNPTLELRAEVVVASSVVRGQDLAVGASGAAWDATVFLPAPAPGAVKTWTRAAILRECVRRGVRPMPRLDGAERVRIRREGGSIVGDALVRRIVAALEASDLPGSARGQRVEVLRRPKLSAATSVAALEVVDPGPRVGRGAARLRLSLGDGSEREIFVAVRRELRVEVLRTREAFDARTPLEASNCEATLIWTDRTHDLDRAVAVDEADGRWSSLRSVGGGHVLLQGDVRATPVVFRGESVEWIVQRGELRVQVRARARNDGAVGEWIGVESPFDRRLRRVVVVAPGRVADHPPDPVARDGAGVQP